MFDLQDPANPRLVNTVATGLQTFDKKRSAKSLTLTQSAIWQNWNPIENLGPSNLADAPVMVRMGPGN